MMPLGTTTWASRCTQKTTICVAVGSNKGPTRPTSFPTTALNSLRTSVEIPNHMITERGATIVSAATDDGTIAHWIDVVRT